MYFFIKGITYFTIGAAIGLLAWVISLGHYGGSELAWMMWLMIPFGVLLVGTIGVTEEILDSDRKFSTFIQQFQWFISGALFGLVGGAVAAYLSRIIFYTITEYSQSILFARLSGMFILGCVMGVSAGLSEKVRMGSWERCFSFILAGAIGGLLGGFLRHELTLLSGRLDFLGITIILFGGILVLALIIVSRLRTSAMLKGHPDNLGVKYGEGFEYPLPSDVDLWIGSGMRERSSPKTRLKIYADNKVDKIQAAIGQKDDGWYLIQAPEFPRYGEHTHVNGKQIKGRTRLREADEITFGKTKFFFRTMTDKPSDGSHGRKGGRLISALIFLLLSFFVVPPGHAEEKFIILPEGKISTETYPVFKVPFRMVDASTGEVRPVRLDRDLDPSQWRVEDTEGRILGDVLTVEPLDSETKEDKLYIVLLIDLSKTMDKGGPPTRLEEAMTVASDFVNSLRPNCYAALIPFAANVANVESFEYFGPQNRSYLIERIRNLRDYRGERSCTALYPAITRSIHALSSIQEKNVKKAVILLTDGYNDLDDVGRTYDCRTYKKNYHPEELNEAAIRKLVESAQIPIYAFGFNLPEEKEKEEYLRHLTVMSSKTDEARFFKDSGNNLQSVYERLDNVTKARQFLLTFKTNLPPNEFIHPPDYYIFTDMFSGSYDSAPARAEVEFFGLPRGNRQEEVKSWIMTVGLSLLMIFILIVAQAFLRIQMISKIKKEEDKSMPMRAAGDGARKPQPRYSPNKYRDGRTVSRKEVPRKPLKKEKGETGESKPPSRVPEPKETNKKAPPKVIRYEHVPPPDPPPERSIPEIDDIPDFMQDEDVDE